jgi:PTH1 family peptidyl-tRNA hydrolase
MDWLVVGLGNPGTRYVATRHNAGFRVVDRVAEKLAAGSHSSWANKLDCEYAKVLLGSDTVWLIKPQKYMNLSGQTLGPFFHFFKLQPKKNNLIIIHDELDFDPGVVRLKDSGSAGGHNGLSDTISVIGNGDFIRVRVGIGHPRRTEDRQSIAVENWVLSVAQGEEGKLLAEAEVRSAELVVKILREGLSAAKAGVSG